MRSFIPPNHDLQAKTGRLFELDGLFYKFITSDSVSCEVRKLRLGFPRNLICIAGYLFKVSMISVLNWSRVRAKSIVIPRMTELFFPLDGDSYDWQHLSIELIAFEYQSQLHHIEPTAFSQWVSLRSICIPVSVRLFPHDCFNSCKLLSSLTFERGSIVTQIDFFSLYSCSSLKSICLPASLAIIDGSNFYDSVISHIAVEDGNRHFRVCGDFLIDFEGITVIRYFGSDSHVRLPRNIEILGTQYFSDHKSLSSLTFGSGSKLTLIEAGPFIAVHHYNPFVFLLCCRWLMPRLLQRLGLEF
jgi:hypothetical protein